MTIDDVVLSEPQHLFPLEVRQAELMRCAHQGGSVTVTSGGQAYELTDVRFVEKPGEEAYYAAQCADDHFRIYIRETGAVWEKMPSTGTEHCVPVEIEEPATDTEASADTEDSARVEPAA